MAFIKSFSPFLLPLILFVAFGLLICLSLSDDLERALAPVQPHQPLSAFSPEHRQIILIFHKRPHTTRLTWVLARNIMQNNPHLSTLRQLACAILLGLKSEDIRLSHYLNTIPFGSVNGLPVAGFPQAARTYFGVSHTHLTVGETLLLCHLAQNPGVHSPLTHPDDALKIRNHLLESFHRAGILPPSVYREEIDRSLSLAPDHRPVY